MASRRKGQTDEQLIARMNAVVDHCSEELVTSPAGFDPLLAPLSWWRKNWSDWKVRKLFIENFIRIRSKHSENRIIPFRLNDVQLDLLQSMTGRDVVLKARQQGISTLILALKLSAAILFPGRNIRFVPHDPEAEEEFWSRLDTMYKHLPARLKPQARYYSKELMQFEDVEKGVVDSRLTSLNPQPGQEDKLRSQTLTDAHLTEIPFWRGDQERVFTALLAAAEKGEITLESTAGGKEKFYFYYRQGTKRRGGWRSHFYEWWWLRENRIEGARFARAQGGFVMLGPEESILDIWNPDAESKEEKLQNRLALDEVRVTEEEERISGRIRDHLVRFGYAGEGLAWHSWEVAEYIAWRRLKIEEFGGIDRSRGLETFLVEHPENDEDCFESSELTVISPAYLRVTCEPQPEALPGREYLIGADTSLGLEASDPSAIEVIELGTGRQAHSEELKISPDLLAYRLKELSEHYNEALIAVERNNTGIATIRKLEEIVDPHLIYKELTVRQRRSIEDGRKTYEEALREAEAGIQTTTANKPLFAIYLEKAVRTGEVGISSREWCEQAQNVIWISNKEWGARSGFHDDRFMALAIANYVRVTRGEYVGFVGVMPEIGYARAG